MTTIIPSADTLSTATNHSNASTESKIEKIAILDCGAQYTKVIDRRIRELKVDTEIFPLDVNPALINAEFIGIILSGGPNSVYDVDAPLSRPEIFELGLPILGICYGMQLINKHFGGSVESAKHREYGETEIQVNTDAPIFKEMSYQQIVLMSHGDSVHRLGSGFEEIGVSNMGGSRTIAAIADFKRNIYGVQFHPEVDLTENGKQILFNFLFQVCGASGLFSLEDRLNQAIDDIRQTVKEQNVFVLVSGGVDSSVTAALLLKALGPEKVYALHIDSGFMRHQESRLVCEALQALGLKYLRHMDAEDIFLNAVSTIDAMRIGPLKTVTDPEQKRRIIGDTFYYLVHQAMEETASQSDNFNIHQAFIAQGTLRPDLIESGNRGVSAVAHKIKTHHNDVPLIQEARERGRIIEPNKDLHKDEVREIGRMLGLPEELIMRQPFPGPGLSIRLLCTKEPYVTTTYDETNRILQEMALRENLSALLMPVKSVGVQGDGRTYHYLATLAGDLTEENWPLLRELARDIPNKLHEINRITWVINRQSLPLALKQITPTLLDHPAIEKLRRIDDQVTQAFEEAGLLLNISQLLAVLLPIDTTGSGKHSIAIRAVVTTDFMTARPAAIGSEIPLAFLKNLAETLSLEPGIDLVMYDVTSKPPATVEWE